MTKYQKLTDEQLVSERDKLLASAHKLTKARADAETKSKRQQQVVGEELEKVQAELAARS